MDPFTMAMFMMGLGQNPEMAGQLDLAGIPPPGTPGSPVMMPGGMPGGMASGVPGVALDNSGFGSALTGQGFFPSAPAEAEPAAAPAGGAAAAGAGRVPPQIKAPEAIKPIMSGGVTGGVQAPKSDTNFSGITPGLQLLQLLMQGGNKNPLRVPPLGAMLRGGQY